MKRYSHCYTLAQVRWASLSEIEVLAWANWHGLSENGAESCVCALFGLFACYFLKELYACVCGVWAWRTKSNRGLGCAWWLDAWWAWNWLSSRRLLMDEESLVWWLHASGARWSRNCYVPVGYYWAGSP